MVKNATMLTSFLHPKYGKYAIPLIRKKKIVEAVYDPKPQGGVFMNDFIKPEPKSDLSYPLVPYIVGDSQYSAGMLFGTSDSIVQYNQTSQAVAFLKKLNCSQDAALAALEYFDGYFEEYDDDGDYRSPQIKTKSLEVSFLNSQGYIQFRGSGHDMKVQISPNQKSYSRSYNPGGMPGAFYAEFSKSPLAVTNNVLATRDGLLANNDFFQGYKGGGIPKYAQKDIVSYEIRRACLFLIDYLSRYNTPIFYALDGLDTTVIAENRHLALSSGHGKIPVCTSEIRELFRMWNRYAKEVYFYDDYVRVPPPWTTKDFSQWSQTAHDLVVAERQRSIKAGSTLLTVTEDEAQKVILAHKAGNYYGAITAYHAIPYHKLKETNPIPLTWK